MSSPIDSFWAVPYASQRDNENVPSGTCNVTCLSMVLQFLGARPKSSAQLEYELFKTLETPEAQAYFKKNFPTLQNYNARNVHGMLGWLAIQRGYRYKYAALDFSFLSQKGPVIISGTFTKSGHICVLLGYTRNQDWIVHDPYGDWNTGYKSKSGALRIYNREDMAKLVRTEVDQIWI